MKVMLIPDARIRPWDHNSEPNPVLTLLNADQLEASCKVRTFSDMDELE